MILRANLPRICKIAQVSPRVLDIGGWQQPFNLATHVVDLMPYVTRRQKDAIDPEHEPRFSAATWVVQDACTPPYPFPDKFFDFCFCSHTLEDLRDPLAVCREMVRVSKAGYIETPSRAREIFCNRRGFALRAAFGNIPQVGYDHHRWFVEIERNHVRFTIKDQRLLASRKNFLTKSDLGRKMTEAESGAALFWEDGFTFEEAQLDDPQRQLREFRDATLRRLSSETRAI